MVVHVEKAARGKRWTPVDFGVRVCLRYLSKSDVLGFVGLFNRVPLNFRPAFLSFIMLGSCCGGIDSFGDRSIVYYVGWHLDDRNTRTSFRISGQRRQAGCHNHIDRIICGPLPGF